ncbi:squalene synthase HpnC [bacterium]|nr:squalene synthase HpnC [bacterium]
MESELQSVDVEALAKSHYENFPVARFVRKDLKSAIYAIYAFARTADDFADEPEFAGKRLQLLGLWRQQLKECTEGKASISIFKALLPVIQEKHLPVQWLNQLLDAFEYDVKHARHKSFEDLIAYAQLSANPIGRCVLFLHGYDNEVLYNKSDALCTALQLSNFWQDISVDAQRQRFYLPQDMLKHYQCTEQQVVEGQFNQGLKALVQDLCDKTQDYFDQAQGLAQQLQFPLSLEVALTSQGGQEILKKIKAQDYNTVNTRPKLNKGSFIKLLFKSLFLSFQRTTKKI